MADANVLDTDSMLSAELDEIERRRAAAGEPPAPSTPGERLEQRQARLGLTALCLSGGGIRSASFCLGVIQALAAKRLLNRFDYVSTVSGGGFIGGWLQMTLRETGDADAAQAALGSAGPAALSALRGYTNYLTPQTGPFSTDTWAGIVLYIRNLLINWMVFTPLFLALALAAIFYRTLIYSLSGSPLIALILLAAAAGVLGVGAYRACALIPSHRTVNPPGFAPAKAILWNVTAPVLLWAMVLPAVLDYGLRAADPPRPDLSAWPWLETAIPLLYVAAMMIGYGAAWVTKIGPDKEAVSLYRINVFRWFAASLCSAGLIWIGLRLIEPAHVAWPVFVNRETLLTVFAPLWLVGVHVLQTTFYVAFRKEAMLADLDREWLARSSAQALLAAVAWTGFAVTCLVLPPLLSFVSSEGEWFGTRMATVAAGTTLVGSIAAWLGNRLVAGIEALVEKAGRWTQLLLNGLAVIYAIGVFAVAGGALQLALGWVQVRLFGPDSPIWVPLLLQVVLAVVLYGLTVAFGRVNVNRYSLHAVYRNRLVRAFLGSARPVRDPDPFTGFDPKDDPRLAKFSAPAAKQRLFPVINATLNVSVVSNAANAERKAESFIATPLACGSAALRNPRQGPREKTAQGAFVPTALFAGMDSLGDVRNAGKGVTIGTALTISGAAVNPNWGYHSSRVTAFLMTLFNVRLGAWLPNPAVATADELQLGKPADSLRALVDDLLGTTTDDSQAVNLSDGGHFENLGLYEMLRRRCSRIVALDAGEDGGYVFFDLGNALRKAAIDLGVTVTVRQPMRLYSRKAIEADSSLAKDALGIAVGDIRYDNGQTGELLYVKPSFLSGIPADVRAFGLSDPAFPHDSTTDQWFTESQFESYRALGEWQMTWLAGGLKHGAALEDLFRAAADRVSPEPAPAVRLPETLDVSPCRPVATNIGGR